METFDDFRPEHDKAFKQPVNYLYVILISDTKKIARDLWTFATKKWKIKLTMKRTMIMNK